MANKVAILGGGAMGTACAILLKEQKDQDVALWMREGDYAKQVAETRENLKFLPGVKIPENIDITADIEFAIRDADFVLAAIPSAFLRNSLTELSPALNNDCPVISVVKGIEEDTFLRPSEIITDVLGNRSVVVVGGPSHAEEISRKQPASVVAAGGDLSLVKQVQSMLSTDRFRVYSNIDLIGVELAGALKNVIAIAAGISDGLGFGDNAKSALLTRGQVEMTRFGEKFGAEPRTFFGLAGIGDLMTTCFSQFSRNRSVGQKLGEGQSLDEILSEMEAVAEGVTTAHAIHDFIDIQGVDMPISEQVYRVLFQGLSPLKATSALMERPLQSE